MTRRDIPNLITGLRIALVAPVVVTIVAGRFDLTLWLFLAAGLSDGLDGWLAKSFAWQSRLGAILDPLADKLLLVGSFLALGWGGYVPQWLVQLVIARDLTIVTGGLAYHLLIGRFDMAPSVYSKVNTFLQIATVLAVVLDEALALAPPQWLPWLAAAVTASTVVSGGDYVWRWGRRAWGLRRGRGSAQG